MDFAMFISQNRQKKDRLSSKENKTTGTNYNCSIFYYYTKCNCNLVILCKCGSSVGVVVVLAVVKAQVAVTRKKKFNSTTFLFSIKRTSGMMSVAYSACDCFTASALYWILLQTFNIFSLFHSVHQSSQVFLSLLYYSCFPWWRADTQTNECGSSGGSHTSC